MKNMDLKILGTSKIGTRGQVTIPKEAREKFNLKPGNIVLFIEKDGRLMIVKGDLKDLREYINRRLEKSS